MNDILNIEEYRSEEQISTSLVPEVIDKTHSSSLTLIEKVTLKTLDDYISYAEDPNNTEELIQFGIIIDPIEKTVDLDSINNTSNTLFGKRSQGSIRHLNQLLCYQDRGVARAYENKKKILKQFFHKYHYSVTLENNLSHTIEFNSIKEYIMYFENPDNKKEFEGFGIIINTSKQIADISMMKNKRNIPLFGGISQHVIRSLAKLIGSPIQESALSRDISKNSDEVFRKNLIYHN